MAFDTEQASYADLRSIVSEATDPIVAWVGAGLSIPAGLPSWPELRDSLLAELRQFSTTLTDVDTKRHIQHAIGEATISDSYWDAFSILATNLGEQSFPAAIRRAMRPTDKAPVPSTYKRIWDLGVSGIINLNVDRMAKRAYSEVSPGKTLHDFTGANVGKCIHLLRSPLPWLAQLHGEIDDVDTWVFTSQDLRQLFAQPGYSEFINACLATRTVLFIGISADDVAAGGHLEALTKQSIDCGSHFWITHRADSQVYNWAEKAGLRVIKYDSGNNHAELDELFDDLMSFVSSDAPTEPVWSKSIPASSVEIPTPEALARLTSSEIREIANAHASALLANTDENSIRQFEQFADTYEDAIYRGWHVTTKHPNNRLLGYTVTEQCKEGAFGTVFRAEDESGNQYALKVLHERVRADKEMLQCFRRGVQSMQILTQEDIPGIVGYHDASEIPATVVMDFIDGLDLQEAVQKGVCAGWHARLLVASRLTDIIRASHRLPQRVLHRDIRPANVMLRGCWAPNPDWSEVDVMVLDFDLSWHVNAFDVSISQPGTTNGYLSPEQVERGGGVSTRHAAVDSFGLGMTLYYVATGVEPRFAEHRYVEWRPTLKGCAHKSPCAEWRSLPERYFRLIYQATLDVQSARADMAHIQNELVRLSSALTDSKSLDSAELLAEEIAARATELRYEWDEESMAATLTDSAVQATISGDDKNGLIRLDFVWYKPAHFRGSTQKWLPQSRDQAFASLRRGGWQPVSDFVTRGLSVKATIAIGKVSELGVDEVASHVQRALGAFKF